MKKVLFLFVAMLFLTACSSGKSLSDYKKMYEDAGWQIEEVEEDEEDELSDFGSALGALFGIKNTVSFFIEEDDFYGTIIEFKEDKNAKAFLSSMAEFYDQLNMKTKRIGKFVFLSTDDVFFEVIE